MDVQPFYRHRSGHSAGYSLMEVMVALVVLSVGMLGIAGLSTATLKDTNSAYFRGKAVAFAWDMAERIRANKPAGDAYAVTETDPGTDGECFDTGGDPATTCDPATLAAHDIFQWKAALADKERGLPDGKGSIEVDTSFQPAQYTITVKWKTGTEDADVQSVVVVTQP